MAAGWEIWMIKDSICLGVGQLLPISDQPWAHLLVMMSCRATGHTAHGRLLCLHHMRGKDRHPSSMHVRQTPWTVGEGLGCPGV